MKNYRRYSVLVATLLLCFFLFNFVHNLQPSFEDTSSNYENNRAVNLSKDLSQADLSSILLTNGYVKSKKDAAYIADTIVTRLCRGVVYKNLYDLQKRDYGKVPALVADSLGVLSYALSYSYEWLGINDNLPKTASLSDHITIAGNGNHQIVVLVNEEQPKSIPSPIAKRLLSMVGLDKVQKPCPNVRIQLTRHYLDSTKHAQSEIVCYAKTDSNGYAIFDGINAQEAYSVLPINKGFEYGSAKGVGAGNMEKTSMTFEFMQLEHCIQLIDNQTLKLIKNDGTITVRTPNEYKATVIEWVLSLIVAWWLLCFILLYRRRNIDPLLIASVMFLSVFSVIMMFAIHNPLTEDLRGVDMAKGVLIGIILCLVLNRIDFIQFYQHQYSCDFDLPLAFIKWLLLPFNRIISWSAKTIVNPSIIIKKIGAVLVLVLLSPFALLNKVCQKAPKGFGWLLLSILLTAALWTPLGQAIGGMKVNLSILGFTFQPSEIAKYLILLFMAAFFTQYADDIIQYSQPDRTQLGQKMKTLSWLIGSLIILMVLYASLGDMGPALVVGITFLLLYSLVKSKVNLDNLSEEKKWQKIFTCDFAILLYGVASFALFLIVGAHMANTALFFGVLWFGVWIILGISCHKQFFETAFLMNMLIFIFIFGGQIMQEQTLIPALAQSDIVERFVDRTNMCVNTWGYLDIPHLGKNAEDVCNDQVAHGLWAIATGGVFGQGLGESNPSVIPAFHTDMILSSIGEQLGWIGLTFVIVALGLLLRRVVVIGYRAKHPFAFYFCIGTAIVTVVQFFIIALGSSGMIPLTGITVPFISYGRVSMILNLIAIGIVLSVASHTKNTKQSAIQENVKQHSVGDYNFPISIVTWTFVVLSIFTLCVWQYYALWKRGETLIHPVYVHNRQGVPLLEYNPRIAILTQKMWAGNIYDRNGVLLATSDRDQFMNEEIKARLRAAGVADSTLGTLSKTRTQRYYPFAEDMYFMLGDRNSGLFFAYDDDNPIGFMAEAQYLSYLRNYDNTYYDKHHQPVKLRLKGAIKSNARYFESSTYDTTIVYPLRDYHELVHFLKKGNHGKPLERHNNKVCKGKFDLHLTVDAKLQTEMQDKLRDYVENGNRYRHRRAGLENNHLLRISVVVLDAKNGDLLTSANYPLPNYERLKLQEERAQAHLDYHYYNDNKRSANWKAYTDRDLGLTYPTAPGSTAKVISTMAALNNGISPKTKYDIQLYEVIDYTNDSPVEPPMGGKKHEVVDMETAFVLSSNCYFINLVNDKNLYKELGRLYTQAGVRVGGACSYTLHYPQQLDLDQYSPIVNRTEGDALSKWMEYQEDKRQNKFNNKTNKKELRKGEWMWAWGQGTMDATPLAMARMVSAVVNQGSMPQTRYVTTDDVSSQRITSEDNANIILDFMKKQYQHHIKKGNLSNSAIMGGKTGTPHRDYLHVRRRKATNLSDGWYIFYVNNTNSQKIAVAVRMERVGASGGNSTDAMWLAREVVIPSLINNNYMDN